MAVSRGNVSQAQENIDKMKFKMQNHISPDLAMNVQDLNDVDPNEFVKEQSNSRLDDLSGGFAQKSINVFAACSGSGKSNLLLHLAYRFSITHDSVCYISFENALPVDAERMQQMSKMYQQKGNFDYFNYTDLELKGYDVSKKWLKELFKQYKYVFLDSYQIIYDTEDADGARMHTNGNALMDELRKIAYDNNSMFFLTWQMARGAKAKSKEEQSEDDLSYSLGVSRYAITIWIIDRRITNNKINWTIKLEKTRVTGEQDKLITLYDNDLKSFYISERAEIS